MKTKTLFILAAIVAIAAQGCLGVSTSDDPDSFSGTDGLFVATTDYMTTGAGAIIHGDPPNRVENPGITLSSDPAAAVFFNGLIFVINRFGFDNIQLINPSQGYATVAQYSTGSGSNPQDIAIVTKKRAYISRLASEKLRIVNPLDGTQIGNVDLSAYADADGFPEPAMMTIIDDRLFVALQLLDTADPNMTPAANGMIVVIDAFTGDIVGSVALTRKNPGTDLFYDPILSKLYVGCVGKWKFSDPADDGGIESIDIDTFSDTYTSDGIIFNETTLGGDIGPIALVSGTQGYAMVSDATFTGYLKKFDPSNPGAGVSTVWTTFSYIPAIAIDKNGFLYAADTDFMNPGVRVFDTFDDSQLAISPIDVGLPPVSFAVMK